MAPERISFTIKGDAVGEKFHADMSAWDVSRLYGHAFAKTLFTLPKGAWSKDVAMPYGKVDVRISDKKAAQPLPFAQIKGRLKSAWQKREQEKLEQAFYEKAKKAYDIRVEERP
jgi:parvulin-like peptidyl-prolyl isomerase